MTDLVFRTKTETPSGGGEDKLPTKSSKYTDVGTDTEVPYLDYEREHGKPYLVSHYELNDNWADSSGGFPKELSLMEEYFANKINTGEIENSINAVKNELKKMEKMTNIDKEGRAVIKIGTLSAYVKFLMETDQIKFNVRRYASTQ